MAHPSEGKQVGPSAQLGMSGGKLCFVRSPATAAPARDAAGPSNRIANNTGTGAKSGGTPLRIHNGQDTEATANPRGKTSASNNSGGKRPTAGTSSSSSGSGEGSETAGDTAALVSDSGAAARGRKKKGGVDGMKRNRKKNLAAKKRLKVVGRSALTADPAVKEKSKSTVSMEQQARTEISAPAGAKVVPETMGEGGAEGGDTQSNAVEVVDDDASNSADGSAVGEAFNAGEPSEGHVGSEKVVPPEQTCFSDDLRGVALGNAGSVVPRGGNGAGSWTNYSRKPSTIEKDDDTMSTGTCPVTPSTPNPNDDTTSLMPVTSSARRLSTSADQAGSTESLSEKREGTDSGIAGGNGSTLWSVSASSSSGETSETVAGNSRGDGFMSESPSGKGNGDPGSGRTKAGSTPPSGGRVSKRVAAAALAVAAKAEEAKVKAFAQAEEAAAAKAKAKARAKDIAKDKKKMQLAAAAAAADAREKDTTRKAPAGAAVAAPDMRQSTLRDIPASSASTGQTPTNANNLAPIFRPKSAARVSVVETNPPGVTTTATADPSENAGSGPAVGSSALDTVAVDCLENGVRPTTTNSATSTEAAGDKDYVGCARSEASTELVTSARSTTAPKSTTSTKAKSTVVATPSPALLTVAESSEKLAPLFCRDPQETTPSSRKRKKPSRSRLRSSASGSVPPPRDGEKTESISTKSTKRTKATTSQTLTAKPSITDSRAAGPSSSHEDDNDDDIAGDLLVSEILSPAQPQRQQQHTSSSVTPRKRVGSKGDTEDPEPGSKKPLSLDASGHDSPVFEQKKRRAARARGTEVAKGRGRGGRGGAGDGGRAKRGMVIGISNGVFGPFGRGKGADGAGGSAGDFAATTADATAPTAAAAGDVEVMEVDDEEDDDDIQAIGVVDKTNENRAHNGDLTLDTGPQQTNGQRRRRTQLAAEGSTTTDGILTDGQLLSAVDMFLNKDQRKRKAQLIKEQTRQRQDIDAAQKLLNDRAQRDSWAHAHAPGGSLTRSAGSSGGADGEKGGSRGAKRPRIVASIFDRPVKSAGGGDEASARQREERGLWKAMPAPYPVCRHHEELLSAMSGSRDAVSNDLASSDDVIVLSSSEEATAADSAENTHAAVLPLASKSVRNADSSTASVVSVSADPELSTSEYTMPPGSKVAPSSNLGVPPSHRGIPSPTGTALFPHPAVLQTGVRSVCAACAAGSEATLPEFSAVSPGELAPLSASGTPQATDQLLEGGGSERAVGQGVEKGGSARESIAVSPEPTAREAAQWTRAAILAAGRRADTRQFRETDGGTTGTGVDVCNGRTSATARPSLGVSARGRAGIGLLPSPASLLFADPSARGGWCVAKEGGVQGGALVRGNGGHGGSGIANDVVVLDSEDERFEEQSATKRDLVTPAANDGDNSDGGDGDHVSASTCHGKQRADEQVGKHEQTGKDEMVSIAKPDRSERLMKIARLRRAEAPADAMWTEVYRPRSAEEVCGNPQTVAALSRWLGEWKEKRSRGGTGDGDGNVTEERNDDSDESDEWEYRYERDSDDEDVDSGLCNMAMLCGPSGVGKTSAVYGVTAVKLESIEADDTPRTGGHIPGTQRELSFVLLQRTEDFSVNLNRCATALGYEVIEVNPSQLRSGAAIRRLFGEAAQSHHVSSTDANPRLGDSDLRDGSLSGLYRSGGGGSRGGGRGRGGRGRGGSKGRGRGRGRGSRRGDFQGAGRRGVEEEEGGGVEVVKAVAKPSLSVILFEEVDVVFEEDVGFLGALRDLRRRAKCPVILTSECYRQEYAPLNCHIFYLPRPRLVELEACLSAVSAAEGLEVSSSALCALAQFHMGDLRACLLTLQACKSRRNLVAQPSNSPSANAKNRSRSKERYVDLSNNRSSSKDPSAFLKKWSAPSEIACWRRLARHVESDSTAALSLAFDTFLPALLDAQRTIVLSTTQKSSPAAGNAALEAAGAVTCKKGKAADGDGSPTTQTTNEQRGASADGGVDSDADKSAKEALLSAATKAGNESWRPPCFADRWPEVWSVSPSSAQVSKKTKTPLAIAPIFSMVQQMGRVVNIDNGKKDIEGRQTASVYSVPNKDEESVKAAGGGGRGEGVASAGRGVSGKEGVTGDSKVERDGKKNGRKGMAVAEGERDKSGVEGCLGRCRVLITGRNFAHPADARRVTIDAGTVTAAGHDAVATAMSVDSGLERANAGTITGRKGGRTGTSGTARGTGEEVDGGAVSRREADSEADEAFMETSDTGEKNLTSSKSSDGAGSGTRGGAVREVFVRFGRDVVPGKVLSDTLIEAFAPARPEPGFVDVVVVVARGPGGALSSDSSLSGSDEARPRHSVLFRYTAPPPTFPPVGGFRTSAASGGSLAGVKLSRKCGKKRGRPPSTSARGKRVKAEAGADVYSPGTGRTERLEENEKMGRDFSEDQATGVNGRYGPFSLSPGEAARSGADGYGASISNGNDDSFDEPILDADDAFADAELVGVRVVDQKWDDEEEEEGRDGAEHGSDDSVVAGGDEMSDGEVFASKGLRRSRKDRRKKRRSVISDDEEESDKVEDDGETEEKEKPVLQNAPSNASEGVLGIALESERDNSSENLVEILARNAPENVPEKIVGDSAEKVPVNILHGESSRPRSPSETPSSPTRPEQTLPLLSPTYPPVAVDERPGGKSAEPSKGNSEECSRNFSTERSGGNQDEPSLAERTPMKPAPYQRPTARQVEWEREMGSLLQATCELADNFSAADAIGGVCFGRGFDGAGAPPAEGGDQFLTVSGRPWPRHDPRVISGFVEEEAVAGPCVNAEGLPKALWNGACQRFEALSNSNGIQWARYSLSASQAVSNSGTVSAAWGGDTLAAQASALRGHCLGYCQRDRADYISSCTALANEPLRARGAASLPEGLTLDRAPTLARICAVERLRQLGGGADSKRGGGGGREGRGGGSGRFRHYLKTCGVVEELLQAERLGRMYEEPAW